MPQKDLAKMLKEVPKYNPCFAQTSPIDIANWAGAGKNLKKAQSTGKILSHETFSSWNLVHSVLSSFKSLQSIASTWTWRKGKSPQQGFVLCFCRIFFFFSFYCLFFCTGRLNSWPPFCQAGALPTELCLWQWLVLAFVKMFWVVVGLFALL